MSLDRLALFMLRCLLAWRYHRLLRYSWRLAWEAGRR